MACSLSPLYIRQGTGADGREAHGQRHPLVWSQLAPAHLDEAHAAHVCRQVEDMLAAFANLLAVLIEPQVNQVEFVAELLLLQHEKHKGMSAHVQRQGRPPSAYA